MRRSSRRNFIGLITGAALAALAPWPRGRAYARLRGDAPHPPAHPDRPLLPPHPEPRPGIDGSRVLTAEQLVNAPHAVELFDQVREIPHIVDGILCYCGCAQIEGYRSLLTCYEDPGMAQHCDICQGQGRLAYARWKEGQTLDQIRRATDARYGHGGGMEHGNPARRPPHGHA